MFFGEKPFLYKSYYNSNDLYHDAVYSVCCLSEELALSILYQDVRKSCADDRNI